MRQDQILSGGDHPEYLAAGTHTGQLYLYAVPNETAEVSEVIDEDDTDVTATLKLGAGKPLAVGVWIIKCPDGKRIKSITVDSGSLYAAADKA